MKLSSLCRHPGLARLKRLTSLESLNFENTIRVSDCGLVHLKGLTNLRRFNLDGTKVTAAGVQDLQKGLPKTKLIR